MQYKIIKIGFVSSSNKELFDLGKAWFAISLAFGLVLGRLTSKFFSSFIIALVVVGTGFLFHELSHKIVAQRYKHFAEFRSFDEMLFLAVIMSFFGFVVAAPGAVMIKARHYNIRQSGRISAAGPLMNLVLALIFFGALFLFKEGFLGTLLKYGFMINSWLALFNMVPVWMFDGAKIFKWNKSVWIAMVLIAVVFVFIL